MKSPFLFSSILRAATLVSTGLVLTGPNASAIGDFPGYTPEKNDLFSTWNSPGGTVVRNTSTNFIGAGLDWSGVGYGVGAQILSRAFVSPIHVFSATHTTGFPTTTYVTNNTGNAPISLLGGSAVGTGLFVDHSVGTLATRHIAPDSGITTYATLDLGSNAAYLNMEVFEVGHGNSSLTNSPRIAATTISSVSTSASSSTINTLRPPAPLQGGDSGGPTMAVWVDPNGQKQLTVIASHYGSDQVGNTINQSNFFGSTVAINAANKLMVTSGFAMRLVGNASTTWTGASTADFANAGNWSGSVPVAADYVAFDTAAPQHTVDFGGTNHEMRGILFSGSNPAPGFSFENGTLQIGRGGIANYADTTQSLAANLGVTLTDHQYWDAIHGDLNVGGNINLNGKLLVVQGDHDTTLSGVVMDSSGTAPGLTKYGLGTLNLDAAATYTGKTWIYGGTLSLGAGGSLSSSTALVLANNATTRLELNGHTQSVSGVSSVAGTDSSLATIDLGTGGRLNIDQLAGVGIYSGRISGGTNGAISLQLLAPTTTNEYIGLAGASDFVGRTVIERGNVYVQHTAAFGASGVGNETHINFTDTVAPALRFQATGTMNETIVLRTISGSAGGTLGTTTTFTAADLTLNAPLILSRANTQASRGSSWNLATLNSNGVVAGIHFGAITGALEAGAVAGTSSLLFTLYKDSSFYLDGTISNGTLGSALGLTYRGDGTISINAANSYTGASAVQTKSTIVNVDALSGQNGAFGNATSSVNVGNQNPAHITGLYAGNGVTIGRNLAVSASNLTGVHIGALNNSTALYSGTVALSRAETVLTAGTNSTVTFNNTISNATGTPKVIKQGAGTVILSGSNTYSGGTTVEAGLLRASHKHALASVGTVLVAGGKLEIATGVTLANANVQLNGGDLAVNGTLNALTFQSGRLGGSGTVNAALALNSTTQILSPGNSPGTQTIGGNQTWSGFTYEWEINDFAAMAPPASTVDFLDLTGELTLGGSYVLDILSLTAANQAGNVTNFAEESRSWTILTADGGIADFNASQWTLDASQFTATGGVTGGFSLDQQGNSLVLSYTAIPEAGTATLVLFACGAGLLRRRSATHASPVTSRSKSNV